MADQKEKQPLKDDTSTAPEAGDPQATGRNRGQVIDDAENRTEPDKSGGTGEHFGSGRQDAAPRSGK